MNKSTITRERIQRIIRAIDSEAYDEEEIREWLSSDEIMELARMALAAMGSEPLIADCDTEVYEKGVSVCLVAIPKETAEVIFQNITAATGCKVDWHYFGGRVHIKALRLDSQPAPVVPDEMPEHTGPREFGRPQAYVDGWNACRAAMLNGGKS